MDTEDLKNFLSVSASLCAILQFLTGILVCQKVVQNKSTGDNSAFPFVSGCLSTALWLRYGFLIEDRSIILVNTVGSALFVGYVVVFYIYSVKTEFIVRQILVCGLFLLLTLLYVERATQVTEAQNHLGVICTAVTILFFAAPLSSLLHVIKVKNTESLPYPIILASFVVCLQWLVYGYLLEDMFIQIPNFLGALLSGFQLSLFYVYPNVKSKVYANDII
ncbi:sugar transporter SWEET1 [Aethina tumida]|uniref:sugar transporter SWEET1 n=1 Tax=Aethina tumida TaxID=116153 RepID=UPI00096B5D76|nr:sugar transporter SWEET1 [Aethina tumida]